MIRSPVGDAAYWDGVVTTTHPGLSNEYKPAKGWAVGERQNFALPAGTLVTVVSVFGDEREPDAYEVEAFLPDEDLYVLATIDACDVE